MTKLDIDRVERGFIITTREELIRNARHVTDLRVLKRRIKKKNPLKNQISKGVISPFGRKLK